MYLTRPEHSLKPARIVASATFLRYAGAHPPCRSRGCLESSMDHSNPYAPPASRVASKRSGLAGSTRILLTCLISAQLVVTLLSLAGGLQRVQHGDISPLAFLGAILATGVLALGGALVVARRRSATLLFIAAALGVLTALQWHPPFVFTGIVISSLAAFIVLRANRPARTAP